MNPRTLEVEVAAAMPNVDLHQELHHDHLVEITHLLTFLGGSRRVLAARKSVEWTKQAAEFSDDQALRGTAALAAVCLDEVAQYALTHNGVIDRAQFFHATNWSNADWHQFAVIVLCWDEQTEETVAVFGFQSDLEELGLLMIEAEGRLS